MAETGEAANLPAADNSGDERYLIFSILGTYYTFPSRLVGEIALFDTVYPLPLMPECVLGIINRYSVPYVLFDIGLLLLKTPTARNKVLVLKEGLDRVAFLIDDVTHIVEVPPEKMLMAERNAGSTELAEIIAATFRWNDADVFVLDVQRLLSRASGDTAGYP
jgi:purine-binding chemotaxis protein CheW